MLYIELSFHTLILNTCHLLNERELYCDSNIWLHIGYNTAYMYYNVIEAVKYHTYAHSHTDTYTNTRTCYVTSKKTKWIPKAKIYKNLDYFSSLVCEYSVRSRVQWCAHVRVGAGPRYTLREILFFLACLHFSSIYTQPITTHLPMLSSKPVR